MHRFDGDAAVLLIAICLMALVVAGAIDEARNPSLTRDPHQDIETMPKPLDFKYIKEER